MTKNPLKLKKTNDLPFFGIIEKGYSLFTTISFLKIFIFSNNITSFINLKNRSYDKNEVDIPHVSSVNQRIFKDSTQIINSLTTFSNICLYPRFITAPSNILTFALWGRGRHPVRMLKEARIKNEVFVKPSSITKSLTKTSFCLTSFAQLSKSVKMSKRQQEAEFFSLKNKRLISNTFFDNLPDTKKDVKYDPNKNFIKIQKIFHKKKNFGLLNQSSFFLINWSIFYFLPFWAVAFPINFFSNFYTFYITNISASEGVKRDVSDGMEGKLPLFNSSIFFSNYRKKIKTSITNNCKQLDNIQFIIILFPFVFSFLLLIRSRYKEQFFSYFVKEMLPGFSLPHQNMSWETFNKIASQNRVSNQNFEQYNITDILTDKNEVFVKPSNILTDKNEGLTKTSFLSVKMLEGDVKSDVRKHTEDKKKQTHFFNTPNNKTDFVASTVPKTMSSVSSTSPDLIERLDIYSNLILLEMKPVWAEQQKQLYINFLPKKKEIILKKLPVFLTSPSCAEQITSLTSGHHDTTFGGVRRWCEKEMSDVSAKQITSLTSPKEMSDVSAKQITSFDSGAGADILPGCYKKQDISERNVISKKFGFVCDVSAEQVTCSDVKMSNNYKAKNETSAFSDLTNPLFFTQKQNTIETNLPFMKGEEFTHQTKNNESETSSPSKFYARKPSFFSFSKNKISLEKKSIDQKVKLNNVFSKQYFQQKFVDLDELPLKLDQNDSIYYDKTHLLNTLFNSNAKQNLPNLSNVEGMTDTFSLLSTKKNQQFSNITTLLLLTDMKTKCYLQDVSPSPIIKNSVFVKPSNILTSPSCAEQITSLTSPREMSDVSAKQITKGDVTLLGSDVSAGQITEGDVVMLEGDVENNQIDLILPFKSEVSSRFLSGYRFPDTERAQINSLFIQNVYKDFIFQKANKENLKTIIQVPSSFVYDFLNENDSFVLHQTSPSCAEQITSLTSPKEMSDVSAKQITSLTSPKEMSDVTLLEAMSSQQNPKNILFSQKTKKDNFLIIDTPNITLGDVGGVTQLNFNYLPASQTVLNNILIEKSNIGGIYQKIFTTYKADQTVTSLTSRNDVSDVRPSLSNRFLVSPSLQNTINGSSDHLKEKLTFLKPFHNIQTLLLLTSLQDVSPDKSSAFVSPIIKNEVFVKPLVMLEGPAKVFLTPLLALSKSSTILGAQSFREFWEPVTLQSWLAITRLSFAFFVLKFLQYFYTTYGRDSLIVVLRFLAENLKERLGLTDKKKDKGYRLIKKVKKAFKDVAGIDNILPELGEMVWVLRNSGNGGAKQTTFKFGNLLPKGFLFVGPPGTGKTFLVQAIAGEAGVPVLVQSGSSLTDTGENEKGARRLKNLFEKARQLAPCIVFIDEIDTLGETRQNVMRNPDAQQGTDDFIQSLHKYNQSSNTLTFACEARIKNEFFVKPLQNFKLSVKKSGNIAEKHNKSNINVSENSQLTQKNNLKQKANQEQLNLLMQLLIELDGLKSHKGVIVIGATNRPRVLDPALTRPGRFDRVLNLEFPGKKKRIEILKLYSQNIGLASSDKVTFALWGRGIHPVRMLKEARIKNEVFVKPLVMLEGDVKGSFYNKTFSSFAEEPLIPLDITEKDVKNNKVSAVTSPLVMSGRSANQLDSFFNPLKSLPKKESKEIQKSFLQTSNLVKPKNKKFFSKKNNWLFSLTSLPYHILTSHTKLRFVKKMMLKGNIKSDVKEEMSGSTKLEFPWEYLANRTFGFSAADLAAAMNQSSIEAILRKTGHTIETIEQGIEFITSYSIEKPKIESQKSQDTFSCLTSDLNSNVALTSPSNITSLTSPKEMSDVSAKQITKGDVKMSVRSKSPSKILASHTKPSLIKKVKLESDLLFLTSWKDVSPSPITKKDVKERSVKENKTFLQIPSLLFDVRLPKALSFQKSKDKKDPFFITRFAYYQAGKGVLHTLLPEHPDVIILKLWPQPKNSRHKDVNFQLTSIDHRAKLETRLIGLYAGKAAELLFLCLNSHIKKENLLLSLLGTEKTGKIADQNTFNIRTDKNFVFDYGANKSRAFVMAPKKQKPKVVCFAQKGLTKTKFLIMGLTKAQLLSPQRSKVSDVKYQIKKKVNKKVDFSLYEKRNLSHSNLGVDELSIASNLAHSLVDKWFFYSNKITLRKENQIRTNQNTLEFSKIELVDLFQQLTEEVQKLVSASNISESSMRDGRDKHFRSNFQEWSIRPWWQNQITKETGSLNMFYDDWYRIYLPDPEESERNEEWVIPDEYYHNTQNLKNILPFFGTKQSNRGNFDSGFSKNEKATYPSNITKGLTKTSFLIMGLTKAELLSGLTSCKDVKRSKVCMLKQQTKSNHLSSNIAFGDLLLFDQKSCFFLQTHGKERKNIFQLDPDTSLDIKKNIKKQKILVSKNFQTKNELYVDITWNDLYKIDRDYIYHALILTCFNKAFSLLDDNRELLDYLADYLMRFETLRQHKIKEILCDFGDFSLTDLLN